MTTAELTTEIEGLTTAERKRVSLFIANLKNNRGTHPARKHFSKDELVNAIKESHSQAQHGKTKSAYQSLREVRRKYGLSD